MGAYHRVVKRQVVPEILDSLAGDDPGALRSRRDLRLINFLMGNERWILKQNYSGEVIELGAGEGQLTRKIAARGQVVGLDLQERPDGLDVPWLAGDLFQILPEVEGETIVANLILHHFRDDQLAQLGKLIRERRSLIAVEPWRSRISLAEGYALWPLINHITKHDMMVSIRAGFRNGELRKLLDLGDDWEWKEEVSLLGGLRVLAWRR
jgi:SAM-dependent methyltransferase